MRLLLDEASERVAWEHEKAFLKCRNCSICTRKRLIKRVCCCLRELAHCSIGSYLDMLSPRGSHTAAVCCKIKIILTCSNIAVSSLLKTNPLVNVALGISFNERFVLHGTCWPPPASLWRTTCPVISRPGPPASCCSPRCL